MSTGNEIRFEVEDGIAFVPGFDLIESGQPSDEEICAIALALMQMLPEEDHGHNHWQMAAQIEAVGKRI